MADQTPPPPPPGFDTVVGAPPPPPGFDTVVGAPAPTPTPTPSAPVDTGDPSWQKLGHVIGLDSDIEKTKGWIKGGMLTGAGLLDLVNTSARGTPEGGVEAVPMSHTVQHFSNWLRTRGQATNPDQETGQIGEAMAELGAIPEGPNKEAALKSLVERYGFLQDLAKFADKYPFMRSLMKVGLDTAATSARAAGEQGIQTGLKTGDTAQTEEAMKTGAVAGGVLAAPISAAQEIAGASRATSRLRPGVRPVGGAFFETQPGSDELLLRNLKDVSADPATQAVDESLGHMGKTAVTNSMNRSNAERAPEATVTPPQRRLAGATSAPGVQMGETPTPQPTEGEILLPARKKQTGTIVRPGVGPSTGTEFDLQRYDPEVARQVEAITPSTGPAPAEERPDRSYRQPQYQYLTEPRPGAIPPEGPRTDIVSGPGQLILKDGTGMSAERARTELSQREAILSDPDARDQIGARAFDSLQESTDDLREQLRRYDDFAASQPHFAPLRPLEAARNTSSLGDAADHLKAAHGQFWEAADQASGGEFSDLRDEEKRLRKQIFGETPTGRLDELRQQLQENQQRQMDFFDRYRTTVSPQEWKTARMGYQDGIVLQNLDDLIQKYFGGITRAEEARGVAQRVFQPSANFNQQLENFYNGGFRDTDTNRQVLLRTIGQDHMDNLKQIGAMFQDATRRDQAQSLFKNIISTVSRHYHGVKGMIAGGAGAAGAAELAIHGTGKLFGIAGLPIITGTIGGIRKTIVDQLINDPAFLRSFRYTIENNLPPRTAGPLLAARMIAGWKNATQRATAARPPQRNQ